MTYTPADLADQVAASRPAFRPQGQAARSAWTMTQHATERVRSRHIASAELALALDDWEVCYPARGGRRILCHAEVVAVVHEADRAVITAFKRGSRSAEAYTQAA